ncbi:helix-turn-helix transcriptional regulator [Rhizobium ruizarguesonis]|jgi:cyanate lyase|uniref:helix-turn-helix domain-containing protein n=1 Tax=Rhizobium ruizarguesonis TaxID=2081791 RepID=UPI0010ECDFA7|nr:helix-turn-helix transcriptional regulator [Rhizobium ruizarguesonis]TAY70478.1 XRE family transcriptional regulator [Rhizobium ruizarguesonis]TBB19337.1 XRE family transcriptional regulator [Rhizobium ruizarguesonis]
MTPYRNPHAALRVGQIIEAHLTKSELSYRDLAHRLGVSDTKVVYFVTGRHYLPVEFAKPVAEALGIAQGELIHSILLQYFPKVEVDAIWEAIATHIFAQQESGEEGLDDERREKQKKKRTKSR